jgi:hypothetical protein
VLAGTTAVGAVNVRVIASSAGRGGWVDDEFPFVTVATTDEGAMRAAADGMDDGKVFFCPVAPISEGRDEEDLSSVATNVATDKGGIRAEVDGTDDGKISSFSLATTSDGRAGRLGEEFCIGSAAAANNV